MVHEITVDSNQHKRVWVISDTFKNLKVSYSLINYGRAEAYFQYSIDEELEKSSITEGTKYDAIKVVEELGADVFVKMINNFIASRNDRQFRNDGRRDHEYETELSRIVDGFTWAATVEGSTYWVNVYHNVLAKF